MEYNLADNKESKGGTWEYTHFPQSKFVKFMYWREKDETPSVTLHVTIEEFNDLVKFAGKLKPIKLRKR